MNVLEVRHFEIVAAICEARSVARAAEKLNLSQPALSHALRTLEERLGVRLFDRARRMTPTTTGLELNAAGQRILTSVREVESRLARHSSGSAGAVRIATECYTCYHWLPVVIQRLRASLPDVTVQIVADATARPVPALLDGEIDIAILDERPTHRRLTAERLFVDELVLITSPEHPFARKKFIVPADMEREHLLAHRDPEHGVFWQRFLEPAGVRPAQTTCLLLTEALIESVKANLGVGVIARWAARNALASRDVHGLRIGRHGLRRTWYAATRRGHNDATAAALVAVLRTDAIKAVRRVQARPRSSL